MLKKRDRKKPLLDIVRYCFDKQSEMILDPATRKTVCTSSRSGKTVGCAVDLLDTAIKFESRNYLYVTKTRLNAKRIIWKYFKSLNRDFIFSANANETELTMTLPSLSTIYVDGADNESIIEKYRGIPWHKVYIDEGQAFPEYLEPFVNEVLSPRLVDWNGTLTIMGTPNAARSGVFFRACHQQTGFKEYKNFSWTLHDNPHISKMAGKSVKQIILEECKRRGVSIENASIQREYFGRWVEDLHSRVYDFDPSRNYYDVLPDGVDWLYILGVDLGWDDADALAVWAYSPSHPLIYLVYDFKAPKLTITALAELIKALEKKFSFVERVADTGGLGKKVVEEIRFRYGITLKAAEKTEKRAFITLMNDDLRRGFIKVKPGSKILDEWSILQWDLEHDPPIEDEQFENHISDAGLYAWREARHYTHKFSEEQKAIDPLSAEGMEEYWKKEEEDIKGGEFKEWWEREVKV